jgi:predicted nucleic acid-binding protein
LAWIFAWLERYQEHRPDFADAVLVHLLATHKRAKVWTFDREFSTIWGMSSRVLDGASVKSRR